MLSFSTFISGFALFAERRFEWNGRPFGPREIGYVFGFVGFLGIILQGVLIGRLVEALRRNDACGGRLRRAGASATSRSASTTLGRDCW